MKIGTKVSPHAKDLPTLTEKSSFVGEVIEVEERELQVVLVRWEDDSDGWYLPSDLQELPSSGT